MRTSRPEIPRFRFDFKDANWELGDHVQEALVDAFLTEYLEADGYFFIRLLTANASDFVVQEILEQLWMTYVTKYGEIDATRAEQVYFQYRQQTSRSSITQSTSPFRQMLDSLSRKHDAKHKGSRSGSVGSIRSLDAAMNFQPLLSTIAEKKESV